MSAVHIIFICIVPFTGTINSTNWPTPNVWLFIAELEQHCGANADALGSNPIEASRTFFGFKTEFMRGPGSCDTSHLSDFNETWSK